MNPHRFVALLVACIVAAGCVEPAAGVEVTNDLEKPIILTYEHDGQTFREQVEPRFTGIMTLGITDDIRKGERCTTRDIIILGEDGAELGRIPPPQCIDDISFASAWVEP
jgi:hypothetical protein